MPLLNASALKLIHSDSRLSVSTPFWSITHDLASARKIAEKLGIVFPVTSPWEPWHCEFRG